MLTRQAPQILDFLCESCKKHLRGVLEFLEEVGIPYFLDARLFREGSWFQQFICEVSRSGRMSLPSGGDAGEERTGEEKILIAEAGRISRAGELMVDRRLDAVAGTIFLDTVARVLADEKIGVAIPAEEKVFLAQLGEFAKRKSLVLMEVLREGGIGVVESLGRDAMKSQLKVAERIGAKIALILGQKEALDGTVIVREVDSGMQEIVPQEKLIDFLKKRMRKE